MVSHIATGGASLQWFRTKADTGVKDQIELATVCSHLADAVANMMLVPLRVGFWFDLFNDATEASGSD